VSTMLPGGCPVEDQPPSPGPSRSGSGRRRPGWWGSAVRRGRGRRPPRRPPG
jgi:hypothetical protein